MGLDWQVNDPTIPSATREYNFRDYRWMTPDPGGRNVVKLDNPQTWNMYAYVGHNPISRNDPSGLYTANCASGDKKCLKAARRFEKKRLRNLKSKHADVRAAAEAWGGPTDKNGITVTFKSQRQVDSDAGISNPNVHVGGFVAPIPNDQHKAEILAEFSTGLGGSDLRQAIAHEGSHVGDDMRFLNSYDPATGRYNGALNFFHFDTEFKAYEVGSEVKPYPFFHRGPNGYEQLELFLMRSPAYSNYNTTLVFDPVVFPQ